MVWEYYKTTNFSLNSPDSGNITGIIRADQKRFLFERFDHLSGEFVQDSHSMAKVTGIGGAAGEVIRITEEVAKRKIAEWNKD